MAEKEKPPREAKVIAIANQKGGTAKTTSAVNLGIGLADQGKGCFWWMLTRRAT